MDIQIIKGTQGHLMDCTAALMNSSLGSHYFQSKESARKAVEEGLNHGTLFVALANDVCTGFMYYIENGAFHSFPLLHLLAVKEAYRGQGIGKRLLGYFEELSARNKFFLVVADFNPDAKRFYENNGYCQVGEIPGLYRDGITEYLMMKK